MFSKFNPENTSRMTITLLPTLVLAISLIFSATVRADSPRFLNCPESTNTLNHCQFYVYDFEVTQEGSDNSSKIRFAVAATNALGWIDIDSITASVTSFL